MKKINKNNLPEENEQFPSDFQSETLLTLKADGVKRIAPEMEATIEITPSIGEAKLKGLDREAVDGFIHPFFNLHKGTPFRSSSDTPNFQNFPKRDKEAYKATRSILKPLKGYKISQSIFL